MNNYATHWQRVAGDGLVYDGPCILRSVVMTPDAAGDYADIYDGRDKESGIVYARVKDAAGSTRGLDLGDGVRFGRGIYVDGYDSAVETTVAFIPLTEV